MKTKIIFFIFLFAIFSCDFYQIQPFTKDLYLSSFTNFIQEVDKYKFSLSAEEWGQRDKIFLSFSHEWYSSFEPEMSSDERKCVLALRLKYHAIKWEVAGQKGVKKLELWWLNLANLWNE
ncbi:MAG: DUF6565 domain-containing protein [Saprospiraceae bacterium]